MRKLLLLLSLILVANVNGQTESLADIGGKELNNKIRLSYILIDQPNITYGSGYTLDPNMGLAGLHYNIYLKKWLYTGVAIHGAVFGDQGGLFTLGVNLGVNTKIYRNLYFDANVHFGGGGGFRSLVNGGGLLYPSIGLQFKKKGYSFGAQYGYVNFFTGIQRGDNISFFLEIPTTFRHTSYKNAQKTFVNANLSKDNFWSKPAVKNVQQVTFDFFFPFGSTRNDGDGDFLNTVPIDQTLAIIGYEYQRYLNSNTFVYAHVDTMYSGLVAGFMDLFFGIGKNFLETERINFFAKFGIGAAGGRIFPENGLTMYPNAGIDLKINEKFGLSAHGGYHRSIGGTFQAYTAGVSMKYYGLSGGNSDPNTGELIDELKSQGLHIGVHNQTFYEVAKTNGLANTDLNLIAVKIIYDISKNWYASGEASFAYEGRSGGYAHGMFAAGIRSNAFFNKKVSLFAEMGVGVAGGGRVDTEGGLLARGIAGINYHITEGLSFNVSGGQMISPFGRVNSTNLNVGMTYSFALLSAKK